MQIVIDIDEDVKTRFCSGLGIPSDTSAVADALYKGTPPPSWVPVSERLPLLGLHKISEDVLITNGFEFFMGYLVERKGKLSWRYYDSGSEVEVGSVDDDVTAWMPLSLPKPYRTESEDEE